MQFLTTLTLCIAALYLDLSSGKQAEGVSTTVEESPLKSLPFLPRQTLRTKRSSGYVLTDCIVVTSEEGKYFYKAYEDTDTVCGVYFLTDPDKIIEIQLDNVDAPCETGGLISLDGQYFPSPEDHRRPIGDRFYEFCGWKRSKERRALLTSQNAGLVQYRLPKRGTSFSFTVRFMTISAPCNILNEGKTEVYTLRNYGRSYNCSFISIAPSKVKILAMNVGMAGPLSPFEMETGSLHKCSRRGLMDAVLIGGSEGLDTGKMTPVVDVCGMDSLPQNFDVVIVCNMTTVKLISSGEYYNSVTFMISPVEEEDLLESSLICGL